MKSRPAPPPVVENKKKKQALGMTTTEILAEEMFFQNICDTVENETETGTTFTTPRQKIN
jgi:hypothetical protein